MISGVVVFTLDLLTSHSFRRCCYNIVVDLLTLMTSGVAVIVNLLNLITSGIAVFMVDF